MVKVSTNCELMENAFPAGPLKLGGKFFVVEDQNGEHMIFSVDKQGTLCLILKGKNGNNELVDLSSKFGVLEGQRVTALAVNQNKDLTIHLVFAVRQPDGLSRLYIVQPLQPGRQIWAAPESLTSELCNGEQWPINIRDFLLVSIMH